MKNEKLSIELLDDTLDEILIKIKRVKMPCGKNSSQRKNLKFIKN
jgi:hypothetical protein